MIAFFLTRQVAFFELLLELKDYELKKNFIMIYQPKYDRKIFILSSLPGKRQK
jgi:hypothetical protein